MWAPQPAHVGRLQVLQVTCRHMKLTLDDQRREFRSSDFAQCGARNDIDHDEPMRGAERWQLRFHPVSKVGEARRRCGMKGHHDGRYRMTPFGIGYTGHRHVSHVRVSSQYRLYRLGPDVFSAGNNEIASPPEHTESAVISE